MKRVIPIVIFVLWILHNPIQTSAQEPNALSYNNKQSSLSSTKSSVTLSSNLLYFAGGLFNVGVEWQPSDSKISYLIKGGYSPFGHTDWDTNMGGWFISPEIRYHFSGIYGWFAGAQLQAGGANIKFSESGYQGTGYAGGVVGGYKLYLSHTFDMDFSVGLGYGSFTYDTYKRDIYGENVRTGRDLSKSMLIPMQAGISIIWKIQ